MFVVHCHTGVLVRTWPRFGFFRVVTVAAGDKGWWRWFAPVGEQGGLGSHFRFGKGVDRQIEEWVTHFEADTIAVGSAAIAGEVHEANEQQTASGKNILCLLFHLLSFLFVLFFFVLALARAFRSGVGVVEHVFEGVVVQTPCVVQAAHERLAAE